MGARHGYLLIRWFMIFTLCGGGAILLPSCGALTRGDSGPLQISLTIPEGEDPALFWLGVDSRVLRVRPQKGGEQTIAWTTGSEADFDLRDGDRVDFLGLDREGRLLVSGGLALDGEKKISIPLHRDL